MLKHIPVRAVIDKRDMVGGFFGTEGEGRILSHLDLLMDDPILVALLHGKKLHCKIVSPGRNCRNQDFFALV